MNNLQEQFLEDFEDLHWDICDWIIWEANRIIMNSIIWDLEWYEDKEKFFTQEEQEELIEVIKQKVYLELKDKIKDFILLKK